MVAYLDYIGWQELSALNDQCIGLGVPGGALLPLSLAVSESFPYDSWRQRRLQNAHAQILRYLRLEPNAVHVNQTPSGPWLTHHGSDEGLFIAVIRCQELVFWRVSQSLEAAWASWSRGAIGAATEALEDASRGLDCCRLLLSSLGSIDKGAFLSLRMNAAGASAVESPGYIALRRTGVKLGAKAVEGVPPQMRRPINEVNRAHALWCSVHIGLAKHFLGGRSGTGGTSGVSYLEARASRLLVDG